MPWNLDPTHSALEFGVKHMVLTTVKGKFRSFAVDANIDEADLANSSATITIDAGSVDTGENDRDNHLRSADFFDAENHPQLIFVTKRLEPKGGEYRIVGDLTIRGVTKEVALEGEVTGPLKDPWGNMRAGISAETKISRKDFGLTWNAALEMGGVVVGDAVKLAIDIELVKAA